MGEREAQEVEAEAPANARATCDDAIYDVYETAA
jgi:hypothetical protein